LDDYIFRETERICAKCGTRNPFVALEKIGAVVRYAQNFGVNGLKGFCTIQHRTKYVVINGKLSAPEQKIVAGHEVGHLILHEATILESPGQTLKDFNLYSDSGRTEYQANLFLANFMLEDDALLECIQDNEHLDYFGISAMLYVPPPLLGFKLFSMARRGYDVRIPVGLDSKFLGK